MVVCDGCCRAVTPRTRGWTERPEVDTFVHVVAWVCPRCGTEFDREETVKQA